MCSENNTLQTSRFKRENTVGPKDSQILLESYCGRLKLAETLGGRIAAETALRNAKASCARIVENLVYTCGCKNLKAYTVHKLCCLCTCTGSKVEIEIVAEVLV